MRIYDIIAHKRDGLELSDEEIAFFVKGYTAGEIRDYQAAALLMAIYLRGMTDRETVTLTNEMAHSGDMLDWFHWTGITPAISQSAADVCLEAIKAANRLGIFVSCDLNYRKNLWKYGKTAAEVMPALVEGCDLILGNEEDADKEFGIKPEGFNAEQTDGAIDQSRFESVCRQLMTRFPRCKKVAITLRGSINANHNTWGGVIFNGEELFQSRRYDITHIVDRVGGGDSFMGGLIYGLLTYKDDQKAIDFATAASALKHTIFGDFNQVSVKEVENLMKGNGSGRVSR